MFRFFPRSKYSEVPNRRADRNKWAGLEKIYTLPAFLLSKLIRVEFFVYYMKNRVERKSEKSKRAFKLSIRDFRVNKQILLFTNLKFTVITK